MEGEQPFLTIRGETVGLGPIRRDLLPLHVKWANDPEVTLTLGGQAGPSTLEDQQAWYERDSRHDEKRMVFLIYELATMRPIGATDLNSIDHFNRTAWFAIFIGEKECWGKGYATEVTRLMLGYAFGPLNLHNLTLSVHADNDRAIRAYARAGFQVVGRRREVVRRAGACVDLILMDCLAHEFGGAGGASWPSGAGPTRDR
jgi:RimJ/RimL family protein N-acetyltransferase